MIHELSSPHSFMLTCKRAAEMLFEFVEESINRDLGNQMRQHLMKCTRCTALVDSYRKTQAMCRNLGIDRVSEQACEKVVGVLRDLHQRARERL